VRYVTEGTRAAVSTGIARSIREDEGIGNGGGQEKRDGEGGRVGRETVIVTYRTTVILSSRNEAVDSRIFEGVSSLEIAPG